MATSREYPQIFIFCYHKSGTQLFAKIIRDISQHLRLRMALLSGTVETVDSDLDIVLFRHSLVTFDLADHCYRGVRVVRDPRGIWVSGYWYHRRCTEHWCTNTDFRTGPRIAYPQVPYSQEHRSETWKRRYLDRLNGRSYQENLVTLDLDAGLAFEETRYADWTAQAMAAWQPHQSTIDVKLESIAADFDESMKGIFGHLGLSGDRLTDAMRISRSHDVARMSEAAIAGNQHITSRDVGLWHRQLSPDKRRRFEENHGALICSLGYPI